jgi:enterochelin esterase-like enzyme
MKSSGIILSALLILSGITSKGQEVRIMESLYMHSVILGQDVKYSICLPEDYFRTDRSYPVVYLLHGLGDDESAWIEYGRINQYADKMVKDGEIVPMIFVIPQGYRNYYVNDYAGTFMYQDMFVSEFIPFIDNGYRTLPDKQHRATVGYSMGGFGALILPLKHPDLISTCVPMSISIRTDEQYMTEDASEWDQQWGRLFGGVGLTGEERITEYYRQNWPFHIFLRDNLAELNGLRIYIDNGDDERTLCRSNEELHILMRNRDIPHEFRVRDGGHSFGYWRSSLPDALRFISDAFNSKPYRGDLVIRPSAGELPESQIRTLMVDNEKVFAFVPAEYTYSDRYYPAIYFAGNFSIDQQKSIAAFVNQKTENNETGPMLLVFLPSTSIQQFSEILPELEEQLRIRKGYRFRSLAGYQESAGDVCDLAITQVQFSSCILMDASLQKDHLTELMTVMEPGALSYTPFFVDAPDKGSYYEGNGFLHILFRDLNLSHEYRVREGEGGFEWSLSGLEEIIRFADTNFHK